MSTGRVKEESIFYCDIHPLLKHSPKDQIGSKPKTFCNGLETCHCLPELGTRCGIKCIVVVWNIDSFEYFGCRLYYTICYMVLYTIFVLHLTAVTCPELWIWDKRVYTINQTTSLIIQPWRLIIKTWLEIAFLAMHTWDILNHGCKSVQEV